MKDTEPNQEKTTVTTIPNLCKTRPLCSNNRTDITYVVSMSVHTLDDEFVEWSVTRSYNDFYVFRKELIHLIGRNKSAPCFSNSGSCYFIKDAKYAPFPRKHLRRHSYTLDRTQERCKGLSNFTIFLFKELIHANPRNPNGFRRHIDNCEVLNCPVVDKIKEFYGWKKYVPSSHDDSHVALKYLANGAFDIHFFPLHKNQDLSMQTNSMNQEECTICLSNFNEDCAPDSTCLLSVKLLCGHKFHDRCIKSWMGNRMTCPICRFSIF